jgi:RimJ/RimL family protein N-acetyltransferase
MLPNGMRVLIRPIRAGDKPLLTAGLRSLSPESARRRFLTPKSRFTEAELRYLTEVDGAGHAALVALPLDEPETLIGVGRYVRLPDDPTDAEVAITIADDLQGQGLGTRLGLLLADEAREHGIERFVATMHSDNVPAHRLFAKISERLESTTSYGVDELAARLAA